MYEHAEPGVTHMMINNDPRKTCHGRYKFCLELHEK